MDKQFQPTRRGPEYAGDVLVKHYLYEDAVQYYQEALKTQAPDPGDRVRISEKIGTALLHSGRADAASPWFDRVLAAYLANPGDGEKSVDILLRIGYPLALREKAEWSAPVIEHAIEVASKSGNPRLCKLASFHSAMALMRLGGYKQAAEIVQKIGPIDENNDASVRSWYFVTNGINAALVGNAEETYGILERALELAKDAQHPGLITTIWTIHGNSAREFGDTFHAKECFEQALFIAQQYRMVSQVPSILLNYAELLSVMGDHQAARERVLEALRSFTKGVSRGAQENLLGVGIPIAVQSGDKVLLEKCAHFNVLRQIRVPDAIGRLTRGLAQFHAFNGRVRLAQSLLHRAIERTRSAHNNYDLMIEIAKQGALMDIPKARTLLERRTHLPHAHVFRAALALFDAFVAERQGSFTRAQVHAQDAITRFEALHLHGYAELAYSVVPGATISSKDKHREPPLFARMQPALTMREREVAGLVLKGCTNREIAGQLHIAPHTVEKHMNSIMNRLGVRSRYQVADLLTSTEPHE